MGVRDDEARVEREGANGRHCRCRRLQGERRHTEALAEERKRQRETESVLETGIVAAGEKKR